MSRNVSFPKPPNPIKAGLKKHGSARALFLALKERAKEGLTVLEWEWYRARQLEWEPDVLAAERAEADRRINMFHARALSVEDLMLILAEKQS